MSFLDLAGRRIEYHDIAGARADAPALVFLHEGLGSAGLWRDFPARLGAATGCRVVAYSRFGYGSSAPAALPLRRDYMHREALDVLPAVRAALGLRDAVLVGHSDGASIALIHAGTGTWPARALILEAPHVFLEEISLAGIRAAKAAYETGDLKARLARFHDDVDGAFHGWNDAWLTPSFRDWNIEDALPGIACPVLAIQGATDAYGTLAQIDAIEHGVRGPFERLVLDCGHAPHREREAAVLAAMTGFVAGL